MKRIILCLSLFAVFKSQAQQINPVPDYVFSNKMSVGRNAVTDTAAYFSIGPRYGAIRGMMPPMVTDTASMSATKRNGLLIFSIQKNKYLYWDSVGSKWAEMAGTAGSAITGSGVAGYMPEFTTATNIDTTRLYHSNGRFAIGSTTTTNGVFNVYSGQSYMDSSLKIGNGELIVGSTSSASRKLYVTSNSDVARFEQTGSDKNMVIELLHTNPNASGTIREEGINFLAPNAATRGRITFYPSDTFDVRNYMAFFTPSGSGTSAERMRIANDGEILIGTTSDAGAYALQVAGSIYNTTGAVFAASSGNVGIGTTSPGSKLTISVAGSSYMQIINTSTSNSLFVGNNAGNGFFETSGAYATIFQTNGAERMRITAGGELLIGTTTDAGAYALQVAGSIYNTTGAVFAASSGTVGIGTASPSSSFKLDISGGDLRVNDVIVGRGNNNISTNTAVGASALSAITSGDLSVAVGRRALQAATSGIRNTAVGADAAIAITTGNQNTAIGHGALATAQTSNANTMVGQSAGNGITTGALNVGMGVEAVQLLTTGGENVAIGYRAGKIDTSGNSNQTGTSGIFIGYQASPHANGSSNQIVIGYNGKGNGNNTVTIGNSSTTDNYFFGALRTSAPPGGTANAWRLGTVATVTPTSPNRTIEVSIGGTIYYIHAKTTND